MKKMVLIIFPVIILLSACALEIANVIGPGGGWVYYDKGNYKDGWRYKECSPYDVGELKDINIESLERAAKLCEEQTDEWYRYPWELPDEADMKKMLECFSYGLTRWSPDYYYLSLSVNQPPGFKADDPSTWGNMVIYHKTFDNKLNGEPEIITMEQLPPLGVIRIRPIRKF